MPHPASPFYAWDIELPDVNATQQLAMDLAASVGPGDLVTLSGELGAGKTTLVRAVLRYLAGDARLEVPSPTFTLLQVYDLPRFPVVHTDLYRITTVAELAELGWDEAAEDAAVFVEWPDRAGALIQADRLDVSFALAPDLGETHRVVRLTGHGAWAMRLEQLRAARGLLDATGYGLALRTHLKGDASTRSYERLYHNDETAILMKSATHLTEPVLRQGRTYSAIAHLAQDVRPFVAMARGLLERGFSAPEFYAGDIDNGLLLLEDFGADEFVTGSPPAPIEERYQTAIDLLVALHGMELPDALPVAPRLEHRLPLYDIDALLIEVELLFDWYMPHRGASARDAATRDAFIRMWRLALAPIIPEPRTWVLRDYHSPNLLWLADREGIGRVGLLDFQDAVLGPPAYDVASILMDARVDVSDALEVKLLSRYAAGRKAQDPAFNPAQFASRYMVLGAQRATKILGIFARLDRRDRKPQYLRHLPRVWAYLMRTFAHPALAEIKAWYAANVPPPANMPPITVLPAAVPEARNAAPPSAADAADAAPAAAGPSGDAAAETVSSAPPTSAAATEVDSQAEPAAVSPPPESPGDPKGDAASAPRDPPAGEPADKSSS